MTVMTPQYLAALGVPAKLDRQLLADFFSGGVNASGALAVTSTGAPRSLSVAAGAAYIPGSSAADQGTYRLPNDSAITLVVDPASTNPRVDQIIARIYDTDYGAGIDMGSIEIAKGTEASGATLTNRTGAVPDGSMPASYVRLADVLVPIGASPVIPSTNIQDRRVLAGLKPGGHVPIGAAISWAGSGDVGDGYWVAADGRLIDKTVYAAYFAWAGHKYNNNVDPGSNKCRIQDMRGRVGVGADNMGTAQGAAGRLPNSNRVAGQNGGEEIHVLTLAESPAHVHYGIGGAGLLQGNPGVTLDTVSGSGVALVTQPTGLASAATEAKGGGSAHNNMQPYEVDTMIVRIA